MATGHALVDAADITALQKSRILASDISVSDLVFHRLFTLHSPQPPTAAATNLVGQRQWRAAARDAPKDCGQLSPDGTSNRAGLQNMVLCVEGSSNDQHVGDRRKVSLIDIIVLAKGESCCPL
jgi:catalase (peroxidase I)